MNVLSLLFCFLKFQNKTIFQLAGLEHIDCFVSKISKQNNFSTCRIRTYRLFCFVTPEARRVRPRLLLKVYQLSIMKYALLVGINYTGTQNQLMGCINDALGMRTELIEHHGYLPENITVITDETETKPTAHNILILCKINIYRKKYNN